MHGIRFPYAVAAPSFVLKAGVAENARFLAGRFPEVGLLLFEGEACLAYTERDLPPDLAALDVAWHAHLPLDLPWGRGLDAAWSVLDRLLDKVAFLRPHAFVLHPPAGPGLLVPLARRLRDRGVDPADVLLENVEESDLCARWEEAREGGFSACLDLGHILAYGQHAVLDLPGLKDAVRMAHVYGPEGGRHRSLARLDQTGRELLRYILETFSPRTVVVEVFEEMGIFESIELLAKWTARWGAPE
ncbi:MAG: cobamide remodeling phosphodiesterase CbiR [Pseudodesulfovibrio sp.]|nr:cobamide remodeling phosphodiesterase CbiR [Pseudodesulfovibrio sp.]